MDQAHREGIAAVRAVLAGFARELTPETVNEPGVAVLPCPRGPGLPPLDDAGFVFESDAAMAVHEAGHAAVALSMGLTLTGIGRKERTTLDEGVMDGFHCGISGPANLVRKPAVYAAGLLSEVLVYGPGTYWARALPDLVTLAEQDKVRRMGAMRHAAARGWRACRLPAPPALDLALTADDIVAARDRIPDDAIVAAIEAFPATLRIAALLQERWAAGDGYVTGDDVRDAMAGEAPVPKP